MISIDEGQQRDCTIIPSDPLTGRPMFESGDPFDQMRQEMADREARQIDRCRTAAVELLDAARDAGLGSGEPYWDAMRWLMEAADEAGYDTTLSQPAAAKLGCRPSHRRHDHLHRLAARDGGWICKHCGIGLIDVCSDEDTALDQCEKRIVRPDTEKVLPTEDHVIPRALGGSNTDENLVLSCGPCNSGKGAR